MKFFLIFIVLELLAGQPSQNHVTIDTIPVPEGLTRVRAEEGSFAQWLRELPLKKRNAPVLDFRGQEFKDADDSTVYRVVDWPVAGRRLLQCMDILMDFRAAYLRAAGRERDIRFPIAGGYRLHWSDWKKGLRPLFSGIRMTLQPEAKPDSSQRVFRQYLNTVFNNSHTQQFYHAYEPVPPESLFRIPGHPR